jgi:hypothetical protein
MFVISPKTVKELLKKATGRRLVSFGYEASSGCFVVTYYSNERCDNEITRRFANLEEALLREIW